MSLLMSLVVALFNAFAIGSDEIGSDYTDPICAFVAATNIETIFSLWSCDVNGRTTTDPCLSPVWTGITCSNNSYDTGGNITGISLVHDFVVGTIPARLGSMTTLTQFELFNNELFGTLPSSIGSLSGLQQLDLGSNSLTGSVPAEWHTLTNLEYIFFDNNYLTSSIPSTLSELLSVSSVGFGYNSLTGSLPPQLGSLTNMTTLDLSGNSITGCIPSSIGTMSKLIYLGIEDNSLSSTLPSSLRELQHLESLFLTANHLSGKLPANLTAKSFSYLVLERNIFTGSLPTILCTLSELKFIQLGQNCLSGRLPSCLGPSLTGLIVFSVSVNNLSGTIPSDLTHSTSLYSAFLGFNKFTGTLPSEFGALPNLKSFSVAHDRLTGPLFTNEWNLAITGLFLNDNFFTGSLPAAIGSLSELELLFLGNTCLSGTVPTSYSGLVSMNYLELHNNGLSGSLSTLAELPQIFVLDVSSNSFSGAIPENISVTLATFNVSGNPLSGSIPFEIGTYSNLDAFNISQTLVSGSIPTSFCSSNGMSIDVSDTAISCYSGCLTSSHVLVYGASSECHNGHIIRKFLIIAGSITGAMLVSTAMFHRRRFGLGIKSGGGVDGNETSISKDSNKDANMDCCTDDEVEGKQADCSLGPAPTLILDEPSKLLPQWFGQYASSTVVLITLAKLLAAVLFTMTYYDWWKYSNEDDNDTLVQSCSNPTVGNCRSYCSDVVIVHVNITHDDYQFDDNLIVPQTSRSSYYSNSEYCVAEFRGHCAYSYWLVFKLVPILLHVVGFLLQCLTWYHLKLFVPQQKQYDTLIAHRYPDLYTSTNRSCYGADTDVKRSRSRCGRTATATDSMNSVLIAPLFSELNKTPIYNVFAFLEVFIVVYVWGELWYPPIYCDAVRPLSLYYYPLLMSALELAKFNVYVSTRLCAIGRYEDALLACLNLEMFLTSTCVNVLLAGMFVVDLAVDCIQRIRWMCIFIYYKVQGERAMETAWPAAIAAKTVMEATRAGNSDLEALQNSGDTCNPMRAGNDSAMVDDSYPEEGIQLSGIDVTN